MFCSGCSETRKKIVVSINSEVEEFCRGAEGCQIEERSHQTFKFYPSLETRLMTASTTGTLKLKSLSLNSGVINR
jgi:hypothetical protein